MSRDNSARPLARRVTCLLPGIRVTFGHLATGRLATGLRRLVRA